MQPHLILCLARKDWRLFLADRQAVVMCFAVPILLAVTFGFLFHQAPDATCVSVLLVAEDTSDFARHVAHDLLTSEKLHVRLADRPTALRSVADRVTEIAVVLPAGFGNLATPGKGEPPRVELLHQPGQELASRLVEGLFTEIVMRSLARRFLPATVRSDLPFNVVRSPLPALPSLSANAYAHSFCGMTIQYLLFWGMDSGLALLRERRLGTWQRLRAAPLDMGTILAGKMLASAGIALALVLATMGVGCVFFGVRVNGSLPGFAVLAVALAVLSSALGLVVAAVGGEETRARSVSILVILLLAGLGGLWVPSFLLPGWVQNVGVVLPTTWASRGLEGVTWQGMGFGEALRCAAILAGFSALFGAAACWRLGRTETSGG